MANLGMKTTVEVEVTYLRARCGVRYWEDATVNGVRDEDGSRIPCRTPAYDRKKRREDSWCPLIELATGKILNWPEGTTADLHYKICDDGNYELLNADHEVVKAIDGYVPAMLCGDSGDDYVDISIGPDGVIKNWVIDLSDFERDDE